MAFARKMGHLTFLLIIISVACSTTVSRKYDPRAFEEYLMKKHPHLKELLTKFPNKTWRPMPSSVHGVAPIARTYPCEGSSCFPATGNLLVGREANLTASSTCGMTGQERYCVKKDDQSIKCFMCDSTDEFVHDQFTSHRISNVIQNQRLSPKGQRPWWQSEAGVEQVHIQFDLPVTMHFSHALLNFKSPRPAAMFIERSSDFGKTWKVYRYFAEDCAASFPGIPNGLPTTITDPICESKYSSLEPLTGGELIFRVIPRNLAVPSIEAVQDLLKITNIRFNFTKFHRMGDDESNFYAISEIVLRGACSCNGHASKCIPLDLENITQPEVEGRIHGSCECSHNTKGPNCEQCANLYNDLPWKPAVGPDANKCKKCDCNNHALSCYFDQQVYEASEFVSGGVCNNCQHNTQGKNCDQCKDGHYLVGAIFDMEACKPCHCDPMGSVNGNCEAGTGQCQCKPNFTGPKCGLVEEPWTAQPIVLEY